MTNEACGCAEGAGRLDDRDLVEAAARGDHSAFDAIVETHWRKIASVAGQFTRSPEEVEDTVQETFIRAFSSLQSFRGEASLSTWLIRIAINLCKNRRQSFWKRWVVLFQDQSTPEVPGSFEADPAHTVLSPTSEVRRAVAALPEKLRLPIALHYFEGMKGAEIAAALGWNESTVWSRIYAGCRELRKSLADLEAGEN